MGLRRALAIVAAIGFVAALVVLSGRWSVEARYRSVEIILDGVDWEALAVREGRDPASVFAEAGRRGATSVAIYEQTLKRMAENGLVTYLSSEELASAARLGTPAPAFAAVLSGGKMRPHAVYVAANPQTLGWLESTARGILGSSRVRRAGSLVEIVGQRKDLEELGLGYLPGETARYPALGLRPVLRLRNYAGLTANGLRNKMNQIAQQGRGYPVVFELTEVLGFDRLIKETADAMKDAGYRYGRIEVFSEKRKQRGEDQLAALMRPDVIRLFSITPEELLVLLPVDARDKFVRGTRERNIRLLYVRPLFTGAGVSGVEANLDFLATLAGDLHRFGLQTGRAEPLPEVEAPRALLVAVAAGALATMALALVMLGDAVGAPVSAAWAWAIVIAGAGLTAVLSIAGPFVLWRQLLALGTAVAIPPIGMLIALAGYTSAGRQGRESATSPSAGAIAGGMRTLWSASVVAAAGGVLVAALLVGWDFMMAAEVFLGVKLAHVLPVILVMVLLWGRSRTTKSWRESVNALWDWSAHPLLLRYAVAALVAGVAVVVLLARSGNFGLPVLGAEERLRGVLEDLLIARPRTKEYLIGHPALFLAGAAAVTGLRRWVLPLAAIGAIGQAGIVNSFSHIHTPLLYTLWRTVNALLLGSVLGAVAAGAVRVVLTWARPQRTPRRPREAATVPRR